MVTTCGKASELTVKIGVDGLRDAWASWNEKAGKRGPGKLGYHNYIVTRSAFPVSGIFATICDMIDCSIMRRKIRNSDV